MDDKEFAKKYEAIVRESYEHQGKKWPRGLGYTPTFKPNREKKVGALRLVLELPRKEVG